MSAIHISTIKSCNLRAVKYPKWPLWCKWIWMGRVHMEWTPFISLIGLSQAVYKVSIFQKKAQDYEVLGSFDTALDFLTFAPCTFVRHALYNLDLKRHFLFFSSQNRPLHWDGPRAALKRDPFIFFVSISLHMFASECTSLTSIRRKII